MSGHGLTGVVLDPAASAGVGAGPPRGLAPRPPATPAAHNGRAASPASPDWRRECSDVQRRRLRAWLWTVAAMTLAVLVVGGVTRLTHSGLSIVEWRPIMGVVPPLDEAQWVEAFGKYRQSPEYLQLRQGMTLGEFKVIFFWEYLHRLLARGIGVVFALPFVAFALLGYLNRALAWRLLVLFALGGLQGLMGWWMVKSGLVDRPSVSHVRLAAHLSVAFVIFGWAVWLTRELAARTRPPVPAGSRRSTRRGVALVGALLALQVVWGAFAAGLKAGLVFNTFPLMVGRLVPPDLWALEPAVVNLVQNPIAVQWMHRLIGTALLLAAVGVAAREARAGADPVSSRAAGWLAGLIAAQYGLGILTLVYYVPVPLAVMHQAAALVIFGVWVAWAHHARRLAVSPGSMPARAVRRSG